MFAVAWPALGLAACQGCRSTGTATTTVPSAGTPGEGAPPTLRLYLVTDMAGALEPCGCTKDQLGGLDHFGAWVKHEQARVPASLVASAGPLFFMDDQLQGDRADQDRIKAQTIARVMHGLGFVAFAPGANDLDDGEAGLTKLAEASGGAAIRVEGKAVVREVGGVRVGFVGYGQGNVSSPPVAEVIKAGVEDAKKQGAEVLVALAAVGRGEAKRIADAVPELTAVVVGAARSKGDTNTTAPQGEQVGDVLIVEAANHLQSVAVLDLYVREPLTPGHVVKFADATGLELARKREEVARRIDELHVKLASWERDPSVAPRDVAARRQELQSLEAQRDALDAKPPPARGSFFRYSVKEMRDSLGKDASTEADMVTYYKAVNDHNRVAFADRVAPAPRPDEASYVGIEACTGCHPGPREVWNGTTHARAYATLSKQFKEFNLECVGCHVTGYEQPGGSTVTHVDKLENVQCEVCHGPGSRHVANPLDKTRIVARPEASRCLECHHPPHVEDFDAVAKMKEILGPGHGLPK
ncbi:MAG TPA: multiheme c-type cytochrome [Polyangiaceae bacterium]|nr:multiheme c-type cytochrome [Polyangiaceae bacterium]